MTFKSEVTKLEEDTFDVGASSDPARFSKSLKAIKTYIQKTYRRPTTLPSQSSKGSARHWRFLLSLQKQHVWMRTIFLTRKTNMKWRSSPGKRSTRPPFKEKRSTKKMS